MDTQPSTLEKQEITFANGRQARLVKAPPGARTGQVLDALGIAQAEAVIVVIGGAGSLDPQPKPRLAQFFSLGVAQVAAAKNAVIVDGGTHAGVMALMGQGVADRDYPSSLIGVAPAGLVSYPDGPPEGSIQGSAPLDPNHSHFVLVEGGEWGVESKMIFDLAAELSARSPRPPAAGPQAGQGRQGRRSPQKARVVVVLAGGGSVAAKEAVLAVRHGWPLIVVEGSGGLADILARWLRKAPTRLDDADLAEIVESGDVRLVRLNGSLAGFRQVLIHHLGDDAILSAAWQRLATYDAQAKNYQKQFLRLENAILSVGVVTTLLVVIKNFLQLTYVKALLAATLAWNLNILAVELGWVRYLVLQLSQLNLSLPWAVDRLNRSLEALAGIDQQASVTQAATFLDTAFFVLIVFLTATGSFLIAMRTQFNPGSKWVLLRYGVEAIKRAIYIYRTRPASYSSPQGNVPSSPIPPGQSGARPGATGDAQPPSQPQGATAGAQEGQPETSGREPPPVVSSPAAQPAQDDQDAEVASSEQAVQGNREEELARSIERVSQQLMRTDVNQAALPLYQGPIPPGISAEEEDDGMSFLTPERYIQYRLDNQIKWYHKKTAEKEHELRKWQLVALAAAGGGTFLAAVGLDLWVALTTAIAGAAISFIQYRQTESTLIQYNQTAASLEGVTGWWLALAPEARAGLQNVRSLVEVSEKIMETEQVGWMQQMQDALESLREEQPPQGKQNG